MYIYYSFSQADIAESLATLTLQQPESDYTRAVGEGCRNMLRALGEQRDLWLASMRPNRNLFLAQLYLQAGLERGLMDL